MDVPEFPTEFPKLRMPTKQVSAYGAPPPIGMLNCREPPRTEDPSLSACPAAFDPLGGAPGQRRTGVERQLVLDVFPVGFNRLDA